MKQRFANNAKGRLNAGITNVATTLTMQAGNGALFPEIVAGSGRYFKCTLVDAANNKEIVKVTEHTAGSDTIQTMVRAQEGTAARAFLINEKVEMRHTRDSLENLVQLPPIETITGNEVLDAHDFHAQKIVTATATVTMPPAAAVNIGDFVDFKSTTTGNVLIAPDGAETIDGVNTSYRLPSFCDCRIVKIAAGEWALVRKPDVEVGEVKWWPVALANPPRGYAFSDNVLESRATLAGLFAVYGVTHGVGDGATTFGKADMRGRVPIGRDDMGGAAANRITNAVAGFVGTTVGAAGGNQSHALTQAETPVKSHTHGPGTLSTDSQGAHAHNERGDASDGGSGAHTANIIQTDHVNPTANSNVVSTTSTDGAHTHSVTAGATAAAADAAADAHPIVQPGMIGNWIVKT